MIQLPRRNTVEVRAPAAERRPPRLGYLVAVKFRDDLERVKRLLREWDPIGVRPGEPGGAPAGEYDSYAGDVLRMLASGCTVEALARHLGLCRARSMRLPPNRVADLASARAMIEQWTGSGSAGALDAEASERRSDSGAPLDVIASRTFDLQHHDGPSSPIIVRFGRPRRIDEGECRCEYDIVGLSWIRRRYAVGADELQALWLALVRAGVELRTSDEGRAGRISLWDGPDLFLPSSEQLSAPEWHPFAVDGLELYWRRYPKLERTKEGAWVRFWGLDVARTPNSVPAGASYPAGEDVGVEQACELARVVREEGGGFKG